MLRQTFAVSPTAKPSPLAECGSRIRLLRLTRYPFRTFVHAPPRYQARHRHQHPSHHHHQSRQRFHSRPSERKLRSNSLYLVRGSKIFLNIHCLPIQRLLHHGKSAEIYTSFFAFYTLFVIFLYFFINPQIPLPLHLSSHDVKTLSMSLSFSSQSICNQILTTWG